MTTKRNNFYLAALVLTAGLLSCGQSGGSQPLWSSCKADADCMSGLLCHAMDINGQCYRFCWTDADCAGTPAPSTCNSEGHCYQVCKKTSDCPRAVEGYTCHSDEPARKDPTGAAITFCDSP